MRLALRLLSVLTILTGPVASLHIASRELLDETRKQDVPLVSTAWFAGWHADDFPVSNVSWSKYTQVIYAFAATTSDPGVLDLQDFDLALLPTFVTTAHQNGVKASVSIGGWGGSRYYSSNVATATSRTAFVKTVTDLAKKYHLDGIDFDWEYPGHQGIGCNVVDPADTANFLSFLQELRRDPVGAKLILTAATPILPFTGSDGNPSADVSGFSKVLDYIAFMNYDEWGPWSQTVGPNAPLDDSCTEPEYQMGSAVSAIEAWNKAGMPANQMVLGVPSYGHSFRVPISNAFEDPSHKKLALYAAFDASDQPAGDSWDDPPGMDICGNKTTAGGLWDFWAMIQAGYLTSDGVAVDGVSYRFDKCSQTPFIYDQKSQVMISYDNAQSFAAKGRFIKSKGLRGFAMWEAGGDKDDILLDSIHAAMET